MPKNERTSKSVGSIAGRILNGQDLLKAERWLTVIVTSDETADNTDRECALILIRAITEMRSLAGSALTQRPDK